jgi:hypothetical protein
MNDAPNSEALAQERREEARRKVREYLVNRQALAFHPNAIRRALNAGHEADFTAVEIEAALAFLVSDAQVQITPSSVGATKYYQATTKGVFEHERHPL